MLSLDNLASRYGCLPTEALQRGSTLDFRVMEVSAMHEKRRQEAQDDPALQAEMKKPNLTQEVMKQMIAKVEEQKCQ